MKKWLLKHTSGRTLCAGLQMATSSILLVENGLYPQEHHLLPCAGFLPRQRLNFVHNNIISKEFFLVFVLRRQSTSHLTCLVSFHRVTCPIQFYTVTQVTSIHSYIHMFIHSYIILSHMHTQHIHHIIHTWLHQSLKVLFGCILSGRSSLNFYLIKCIIPRFVGLQNFKCFHSPLCRITEFQVFQFPAFFGLQNVKCFNSPFCRIMEFQVFQFPTLSDYGISRISFPGLSNYGMSNV
jgi:hypothetical protein